MTSDPRDPFREARKEAPVLVAEFQGEKIPMILRMRELREATKDWQTLSSDAPRRVPIPSEEEVRTVRQYPLEVDPPVHAGYRKLVEPFFLQPRTPEFRDRLERLASRLVKACADRGTPVEIIHDFAVPLQSYALAYLMNVNESEAKTWISWGVHVFKVGDGTSKGPHMEAYCNAMFDAAIANPGEDFFSIVGTASIDGRPLTREEMLGYANIMFAGGRDTIIQTVAGIVHYFSIHPEALLCMREHPEAIPTAAEEFFRVVTPLTHIGRVCPRHAEVHGHSVEAGGRVSLCWASANRDEEFFESPDDVRLDRKPNPHIAFGFGPHVCLGAHHARAVMRALIKVLANDLTGIEFHGCKEHLEKEVDYTRSVGFDALQVSFLR